MAGTVGAGAGAGVERAGVPWVDLTVRIWNVPFASQLYSEISLAAFGWADSVDDVNGDRWQDSHCGSRVHSAVTYAAMPSRESAPCIKAWGKTRCFAISSDP